MKFLKLRGRIKEKGLTEQDFAKQINLSRTSLSLRLNGKAEWTLSEIESTCKLLEISDTEVPLYFFNRLVQQTDLI